MKRILLAVCLAALMAPMAVAQTPPEQSAPNQMASATRCFSARMRNSSGMFMTLDNGQRFQVLPGSGRSTVTTWLPMDRLQVCRSAGSMFDITNNSRARPSTIRAMRASTTRPVNRTSYEV